MLDLIEIKPKLNLKKVVIVSLIGIFLLVAMGVGIVKLKEKYKYKVQRASVVANIDDFSKFYRKDEGVVIEKKEEKQLPIYSDAAKERMQTIYGPSERKVAYLTFDDGPSKSITPLILDVLKQYNIKATFFVLGTSVERNPDIVKRAYEEGHYIANHGYSHKYTEIYGTPEGVLNEYIKGEECIKNAIQSTEYKSFLFRFPGGSSGGKYSKEKELARQVLKDNNIAYVDWNCLTEDAVGNPTKEQLMQKFQETMVNKNSLVILMHDSYDKVLTYELLPEMIKYLQEQGYAIENFYSVMK